MQQQVDLDLGLGTHVRVKEIRPAENAAGGGCLIPLDYEFLVRGKLSRYQVNKRLSRFMVGLLRQAAYQGEGVTVKQRSACIRDRAWINRNIRVLLEK